MTFEEAMQVAREFSATHNCNETRSETYAELWLDATKDYDGSDADSLRHFLQTRLAK